MSKKVIGLGVNLIQIEMIKLGHEIRLELKTINQSPMFSEKQRQKVFYLTGKLDALSHINDFIRTDGNLEKETS